MRMILQQLCLCLSNFFKKKHEIVPHVISDGKKEIEIIAVSTAELGFNSSAKLKDIYIKAKKLGYSVCSRGFIPLLIPHFIAQNKKDWRVLLLEPSERAFGQILVLNDVQRKNPNSWLISCEEANPNRLCGMDEIFCFTAPLQNIQG